MRLLFVPAEYGSVICDGVPLADVPMELQESRVFRLTLRDNQMIRFPDAKLSGSGKYFVLCLTTPAKATVLP